MTLRPGCFQSALAAQGSSVTCERCPDRPECFAGVLDGSPALMDGIARRMRIRSESEEDQEKVIARVKRYLDRELKPKKPALRSMGRVDGLRSKIADANIDVGAIKKGGNPFAGNTDFQMQYQMTLFINEGCPFKPKDVIEHLSESSGDRKTSSLAAEVSRFLTLLVEEGVLLRKERHILCLA